MTLATEPEALRSMWELNLIEAWFYDTCTRAPVTLVQPIYLSEVPRNTNRSSSPVIEHHAQLTSAPLPIERPDRNAREGPDEASLLAVIR